MTVFKLAFWNTLRRKLKPPRPPEVTDTLPEVEDASEGIHLPKRQKLVVDALLAAIGDTP